MINQIMFILFTETGIYAWMLGLYLTGTEFPIQNSCFNLPEPNLEFRNTWFYQANRNYHGDISAVAGIKSTPVSVRLYVYVVL